MSLENNQSYSSQLPASAYTSYPSPPLLPSSLPSESSQLPSSFAPYSPYQSSAPPLSPPFSPPSTSTSDSVTFSSQLPSSAYTPLSPYLSSSVPSRDAGTPDSYSSQLPSSAYTPSSPFTSHSTSIPSSPPPVTPSVSDESSSPAVTSSYASQLPSSAFSAPPTIYAPSFSSKRAVLVGICYIGDRQARLNGCYNDVENVRLLLISKLGFSEQNMLILTDNNPEDSRRPTKSNILSALKWLVAGTKSGDSLFFFFSGHGSQTEDLNGDEADGKDETLLPEDYNFAGSILDDELYQILAVTVPRGARLTCLFDCCHSGTGLDLPYIYNNGRFVLESDKNGSGKETKGFVVLFSGCADSQTSTDARVRENNATGLTFAGAMTNSFCRSLESAPTLSYNTLLQLMQKHCSERGVTQTIQFSSGNQFDLNSSFST